MAWALLPSARVVSVRTRLVRAQCVALVAAVFVAGCFVPGGRHTMRFDLVQEPAGAIVIDTKSYFLWGLVPTVHVDVLDKCPWGAVAIVDGSEAGSAPIWLPTLGLWSTRATTYYCRRPPERADRG